MKYYLVKQNSEEWERLRLGVPTASCFDQIVTPKRMTVSDSSERYMAQLLAEWIFNAPLEEAATPWMDRGHDMEPEAVRSYAFERDCEPEECGFFTTDDGAAGASPDRIVGGEGLLEIKAPRPEVHALYMLRSVSEKAGVDERYMLQLQGQLWVTERQWVDVQSYCPGFPTVIIRVPRDEKYIGVLSMAVMDFAHRLESAKAKLTERYGDFRPKLAPKPVGEFGISDADVDAILRMNLQ